jgi:elongation factor P
VISSSEFKRGQWIELDGEPWQILDVNRQTPSARGASMLVKAKLKNPKTGYVQDKTFKGGDKVNEPLVEERPVQFLYSDPTGYHFMDSESYEQFMIATEDLGEAVGFLVDNLDCKAMLFEDQIMGINLPAHVDLRVTECPPAASGVSGNQTKTATVETGLTIQVPPFITQGELVRVDTRDGRFVQRAKE